MKIYQIKHEIKFRNYIHSATSHKWFIRFRCRNYDMADQEHSDSPAVVNNGQIEKLIKK